MKIAAVKFGLIAVVGLGAQTADADAPFLMSKHGLCTASAGEIEESDALFLKATEVGNHFSNCSWSPPLGSFLTGGRAESRRATCNDQVRGRSVTFDFAPLPDGDVIMVELAAGTAPIHFYRCD